MRMNPKLRAMVGSGARADDIHQAAVKGGMIDLKAYSARLLVAGLTTVEEVMSVVSVE